MIYYFSLTKQVPNNRITIRILVHFRPSEKQFFCMQNWPFKNGQRTKQIFLMMSPSYPVYILPPIKTHYYQSAATCDRWLRSCREIEFFLSLHQQSTLHQMEATATTSLNWPYRNKHFKCLLQVGRTEVIIKTFVSLQKHQGEVHMTLPKWKMEKSNRTKYFLICSFLAKIMNQNFVWREFLHR